MEIYEILSLLKEHNKILKLTKEEQKKLYIYISGIENNIKNYCEALYEIEDIIEDYKEV